MAPSENRRQIEINNVRKKIHFSGKFLIFLILIFIVVAIAYYALLDRYTPLTSDGYVQAYVTQIAPQVNGRVTAVHVTDNEQVAANQLLFELDARPYAYAVDQLKADLTLARKEVALLEQDLDLANELIEQVKADLVFADKEYKRYSSSAGGGATPMIQVDQAKDRLSVKQALLQESMAKRAKVMESLNAKIGDENALVAKAQASLRKAEYDLQHTKTFAPTDGVVTNLQLTAGTYVKAGTAVMTFVDTEAWWIVGNFRENSLALMRSGQQAEVTLAMVPGRTFDAVVESVGRGVGGGQGIPSGDLPEIENPKDWVKLARRFPVRLRLRTPGIEKDLRVGGTVTVVVYTGDNVVLNALARLWLDIASILNFVY
jgi:multidrug resistance efflux pump